MSTDPFVPTVGTPVRDAFICIANTRVTKTTGNEMFLTCLLIAVFRNISQNIHYVVASKLGVQAIFRRQPKSLQLWPFLWLVVRQAENGVERVTCTDKVSENTLWRHLSFPSAPVSGSSAMKRNVTYATSWEYLCLAAKIRVSQPPVNVWACGEAITEGRWRVRNCPLIWLFGGDPFPR